MPKCTVCHHPQLFEIDQALLSGDFTLAALSQKFGPSSSALQRHKGHLRDKMQESRRRLQEIREQGSLLMLNSFLDHVKKGVEAAEADSNLTGVFRGSYIGSRIIYQLNRMEGSMSLDTLHRLLTSPAWVPQGSLLPTDPKLITDLHQALVDGAFGPCPEPVPLISDNDNEEDEYSDECEEDEDTADDAEKAGDHDAAYPLPDNLKLSSAFSETENGKRQTENDFLIRQLQDLLPDLDLTLADLQPRTEKPAKNYRKISEKLAKNTPGLPRNSQQNHQHTPSEKKLPKNPGIGQENEVHPAVSENAAPPAVPDSASPPEVLDEPLAAELTAYLRDFPPYARPAQNPAPTVGRETDACPATVAMTTESPATTPETENDHLPDPCSLVPDPCLLETENPQLQTALPAPSVVTATDTSHDMFITGYRRPTSFPLAADPPSFPAAADPGPAAPAPPAAEGPGLYCRSADELFLMTHGYPRDNPPKHIPNRRLDEDTRGFSLFREIKKHFM